MTLETALVLLALFQLKHMFADYFLQTQMMLCDRSLYFHRGRALHCLIHMAGSALCLALVGIPLSILFMVVLVEGVVHFHIDYGKGRWSESKGHTPRQASYWRAFGVDQCLHQFTYLGMLLAVA